jgi:hypothetical protein
MRVSNAALQELYNEICALSKPARVEIPDVTPMEEDRIVERMANRYTKKEPKYEGYYTKERWRELTRIGYDPEAESYPFVLSADDIGSSYDVTKIVPIETTVGGNEWQWYEYPSYELTTEYIGGGGARIELPLATGTNIELWWIIDEKRVQLNCTEDGDKLRGRRVSTPLTDFRTNRNPFGLVIPIPEPACFQMHELGASAPKRANEIRAFVKDYLVKRKEESHLHNIFLFWLLNSDETVIPYVVDTTCSPFWFLQRTALKEDAMFVLGADLCLIIASDADRTWGKWYCPDSCVLFPE